MEITYQNLGGVTELRQLVGLPLDASVANRNKSFKGETVRSKTESGKSFSQYQCTATPSAKSTVVGFLSC